MIAKTKIGPFRAMWVLSNNYEGYKLRTTLRLDMWVNRSKVVGASKRGKDGKMVVDNRTRILSDYRDGR